MRESLQADAQDDRDKMTERDYAKAQSRLDKVHTSSVLWTSLSSALWPGHPGDHHRATVGPCVFSGKVISNKAYGIHIYA